MNVSTGAAVARGQLHHALRLPVPLRVSHAEVAELLLLGAAALLVTHHAYALSVEAREAGDHGGVVAEDPVAVQLEHVVEDALRGSRGSTGARGAG